jgi:LmbE family N-acetylglucosaminyl deacetylase
VRLASILSRQQGLEEFLNGLYGKARPIVIIAHPDDEVFCGSLCCEFAKRGMPVSLLAVTSGEGARMALPAAEIGALRQKELACAAEELGISRIEFMGVLDPGKRDKGSRAFDISDERLTKLIHAHVEELDGNLVVTHGSDGEYGHPAHILLNKCVKQMIRRNPKLKGLGMNAWRPRAAMPQVLNRMDLARLHVDGTEYDRVRTNALNAHSSQKYIFEQLASGTVTDYVAATRHEYYSFL